VNIIIRQTAAEDRSALVEFFNLAFPGQHRYPERWEWLYKNNPFLPAGFGVPSWTALDGERIIGHTGAMLVPVTFRGQTVLAAWSVDTYLLPEARGCGVGKALQAANQHAHRLFMSLEMSPVNRAIKKKLGGEDGPATALFYRPLKVLYQQVSEEVTNGLQHRFGRVGTMIALAGSVGGWQILCRYLDRQISRRDTACPFSSRHFSLMPVSGRFGDAADELWSRVRERYTFAVERTSCYLNWKYFEQPFMPHQSYYVVEGDTVQGLLVLRCGNPADEPPLGVISECYLVHPTAERYQELVAMALELLVEQGVVGIWAASADEVLESVLASQGFFSLRREPMVLHSAEGIPAPGQPALLSKGDHDWDQYPNLRQPSVQQLVSLAMRRKTIPG